MNDTSFLTERDIEEINRRGISREEIIRQINILKKGAPHAELVRPCTVGDGIVRIPEPQHRGLFQKFENASLDGKAMKFVPASGAATRMFKLLYSIFNNYDGIKPDTEEAKALDTLKNELPRFPFYSLLKEKIQSQGMDINDLISKGEIKLLIDFIINEKGLNFGSIPKGLIPFHRYEDEIRTPFEEHMIEGIHYLKGRDGLVRIHFTVSPEYEEKVKEHTMSALERFKFDDVNFEIGISLQSPSTDTIALDSEQKPFRLNDGSLLFRPGGHGALLGNLNSLEGDIVFIKNIDNVVPDRLKPEVIYYEKLIGGYLLYIQDKVFSELEKIVLSDSPSVISQGLKFIQEELFIIPPDEILAGEDGIKRSFLIKKLNRPIRVCAMVKNEGEPGGGPFWVRGKDGGISMQIVESAQVDMSSSLQKKIWESSTHFNPVDMVCAIKDRDGKKFDLMKYRDNEAVFISQKSKEGRDLKALEHPGLWNGSMADWITLFVEVPSITFNPVKTVFDLLRPAHQNP